MRRESNRHLKQTRMTKTKRKKLIRSGIKHILGEDESELIMDQDDLNRLYQLKIREEVMEIFRSDHKDLSEFADLLQVVTDYAIQNGFSFEELIDAVNEKARDKGRFGRLALNNLNPNNPSNAVYFYEGIDVDVLLEDFSNEMALTAELEEKLAQVIKENDDLKKRLKD